MQRETYAYLPSPVRYFHAKFQPNLTPFGMLQLIRYTRQIREKFFDKELFADPAWDILLALKKAEFDQRRVTVTDLCSYSGVPATTALRWIAILTNRGMLVRRDDPLDGRRTFLSLETKTSIAVEHLLDEASQHLNAGRSAYR